METVCDKDVDIGGTRRIDKGKGISASLPEDIVADELERFKLKDQERNDDRDKYTRNHTGVRISAKQCHDNNNNDAKSKSQSLPDNKKPAQRAAAKSSGKKLVDQKLKKQTGNLSQESRLLGKQAFKSKDDPSNLRNDQTIASPSTDSNGLDVRTTSKYADKYGRRHGCSRNTGAGKGVRATEHPCFKQQHSTVTDSGSRSRSLSLKAKPPRNEVEKNTNEVESARRCPKVEISRIQSYNAHCNKNKQLTKSQQRYPRKMSKVEENCSSSNSNSNSNSPGLGDSVNVVYESRSKKRCGNQGTRSNLNGSEKACRNSSGPECSAGDKDSASLWQGSSAKPIYLPRKPNYRASGTKNSVDRNVKTDQAYAQKFKKDSNVYRRSMAALRTSLADLNGKAKTEEQKGSVADNDATKDCRMNSGGSLLDATAHCHSEGSRATAYPCKTSNGACKDFGGANVPAQPAKVSQVLQVSCSSKAPIRNAKTEGEGSNDNDSNKKSSIENSEVKSAKFSDNVARFCATNHPVPYFDNSAHQGNRFTANSLHRDLQNPNGNNAERDNSAANVQFAERGKTEATLHMSQQQHTCTPVAMGNNLLYQNVPAVYINQYSGAQTVARKMGDDTAISHSTLAPNASSYPVGCQGVPNDSSGIFVHNGQPTVLPPPGFRTHSITPQHGQWSLPVQEVLLFGNVQRNSTHPMNVPLQNSRHVCNTDFNGVQQPGYLRHPLFYVSPMCMQSWNPLVQYPTPLYQNPQYNNCGTFVNQAVPPTTTLPNSQNQPYKHFQPPQSLESASRFSVPVKFHGYSGNAHGPKSTNVARMQENSVDVDGRGSRCHPASVSNSYQNYPEDVRFMVPPCCPPSNMHVQRFAPRVQNAATYRRVGESCDVFRNDIDSAPAITSPRECSYYGVNYARQDPKSAPYGQSVNAQHFAPQFERKTSYCRSAKELSSRVSVGHGARKSVIDQ